MTMLNFADSITQTEICKILSLALPSFYKKTNLKAELRFSLNQDAESIEISLGFLPREPKEEEYILLFEEINNAEKLLLNDYILKNIHKYENLKQFEFKHREETLQIINKQKDIND